MKQIATLKIYLDPLSEGPGPDSSNTRRVDEAEWSITLKPNGSIQPEDKPEQRYPLDSLAHELGHFVSELFGLPIHTATQIAMFMGIDVPMAPREIEAWSIAEKINSAMADSPTRKAAMEQYERGDARRFVASRGE